MELTLKERMKYLESQRPKIEAKITTACRDATLRAVEKAMELTPPTQDDLKGTNTRSGEAKQHWGTDSETEPKKSGDRYITALANDKEYISYVNDGHRMDRHFVPGLYINPYSGLLEYDPSKEVGIVVGTKTSYVPGIFMVEAAKGVHTQTLFEELASIGEVFE